MNIIQKVRYKKFQRKVKKEYIKEVEKDFLLNKYKIICIIDLLSEYKKGSNPFTVLKRMSDLF